MTSGQRLITLLAPQPGELILDVGCGMGDLTALLAGSGARLTGLDHSAVLLEQARLRHAGIEWRQGDFLRLQPVPLYDAVFSHATMHWFGPYPETARRLYGWLRPGGRIAVSTGGVGPALAMMEASLPSAAELEAILRSAGFQAVRTTGEPGLVLATASRPI